MRHAILPLIEFVLRRADGAEAVGQLLLTAQCRLLWEQAFLIPRVSFRPTEARGAPRQGRHRGSDKQQQEADGEAGVMHPRHQDSIR